MRGSLNWKWLLGLGALLGLVALIALIAASSAYVLPPTMDLDNETLSVAKGLYCPVCPGVALDVCETQACVQWRALIREKLAQGQTPAQIQEYFEEQYGERVLGAPRPRGSNLVVYVVPFVAVLIGAVMLYFAARRWVKLRPTQQLVTMPNEFVERIENDLKELM